MIIKDCFLCDLHIKRKNIVNGTGNDKASFFILGESPGYYEDKTGKPFVGKSGQYLRSELSKRNINEDMYFITNVIRCKPNSKITKFQLKSCKQHWLSELKKTNPDIILLLGRHSINSIFPKENNKMGILHNTVIKHDNKYFILSYHPSYILRNEMYNSFSKVIDTVAKLYKNKINPFL